MTTRAIAPNRSERTGRSARNGKPDDESLPPHDEAAEAGALACVLTAAQDEASAMLEELELDDFYDLRHREIFNALRVLHRDGKPLDSAAVVQFLRDKKQLEPVGGVAYLATLPGQSPSPANFPNFLETVRDRAARRAALSDATEISRLARDTAIPVSALTDAARRHSEAYASNGKGHRLTIRKPDELLSMTFDDSDRILGDRLLATGQSLVIAGAGSLGKSRLLFQLAVATITGRQFLGFETRGPELRWLILQAENSNRRLQTDLLALRKWAGNDWSRVNEQMDLHTLETDADGLLSLSNSQAQQLISQVIRDRKPDVVCWDSLYNFSIGDLNKDEDMAATLLTISRLTKAGNPHRASVILHHALTGKAGAARATGYDRSSHGRNSKVLFAWTRGQINIAPGSADNNDTLVLSCGKCSNGKEFAPFAARLDQKTMVYELAQDFDLALWEAEVTGKREPVMTIERVAELCRLPVTKAELAKAIIEDCGCSRATAYRHILAATARRTIRHNKANDTYVSRG